MSPAAFNPVSRTSVRRHTAREGKRTIGISVLAFFAAIAVVGWFGLSGIQGGEVESTGGRQVIFAGGSPRLAVVEEVSETEDIAPTDEEYEIGSFGEPIDEFYADDDEGGWGESARDLLDASREGGRGRGSQRN